MALPTNDDILEAAGDLIEAADEIPAVTVTAWLNGKPIHSASAPDAVSGQTLPDAFVQAMEFDYLSWFYASRNGDAIHLCGVSARNGSHMRVMIPVVDGDVRMDDSYEADPFLDAATNLLRQIRIARHMANDPGRGPQGRWN